MYLKPIFIAIGLLFIFHSISYTNAQNHNEEHLIRITTNVHRAHATVLDETGLAIDELDIPGNISLSEGIYTIRVTLAGYRTTLTDFEVGKINTHLRINLEPASEWTELINLNNQFYRVVGFQEIETGYLTLIDTVDQEVFDHYDPGNNGEIPISHFVYSPADNAISQVENHDFPQLAALEQAANHINNWTNPELSYNIISPLSNYLLVPAANNLDHPDLSIIDLNSNTNIPLDISIEGAGIPWNDDMIFWSQDESQVILSWIKYAFGAHESFIIDIGKDTFTAQVTPISDLVEPIISNVVNISVVSATPDLSQVVIFVTDDEFNSYYVLLDQERPVLLPVSVASYGFSWTDSGNLIVLNEEGLIELEVPSLDKKILLSSEVLSTKTIDRVLISPDLRYMIVSRPPLYDAALLVYDLDSQLQQQH